MANLFYRLRFMEDYPFASDAFKFLQYVVSRAVGRTARSLHLSWDLYTKLKKKLVLPDLFVKYTPIKDEEAVRCLCCGGALFLEKEWNVITGYCGRKKSKEAACPSWEERGIVCSIIGCGRYTGDVLEERDRWMVFKSWIAIEEVLRHGWCIVRDVAADVKDIVPAVTTVLGARARLLRREPLEVLIFLPRTPIPREEATLAARKHVKIVPISESRKLFHFFIHRAIAVLKNGMKIEEAYPVWHNVQIVT
jgi:hypothetical protein